jgi:hypothetical protein
MRYYAFMLRTKFVPTILVIILGVNLGAWTLSVATTPGSGAAPLTIPISNAGIDAHSQSASVASTQETDVIMPATVEQPAAAATTADQSMTATSTGTQMPIGN